MVPGRYAPPFRRASILPDRPPCRRALLGPRVPPNLDTSWRAPRGAGSRFTPTAIGRRGVRVGGVRRRRSCPARADILTGRFRGTVIDNDDPLRLGRLRALVPDALGDTPSGWPCPRLHTPVWASVSSLFRCRAPMCGSNSSRATPTARFAWAASGARARRRLRPAPSTRCCGRRRARSPWTIPAASRSTPRRSRSTG